MATADTPTDNKLGVSFKTTKAAVSAALPEYPGTDFKLGETVNGSDCSKYVFAAAPVAVPIGGVVYFDVNWNANLLTSALAGSTSGLKVGVASQTPFAAGERGWFQVDGLCPAIAVAANTAANSQLYSTATPGVLTSVATGAVAINGIETTTVNGAAAAPQPGILSNPRILLN